VARNNNPRRRGRRRQRGAAPRAAAPITPRPTRASAPANSAGAPADSQLDDAAVEAEDFEEVQAAADGGGLSGLPARPRRRIQAQAPTTEDTPRVRSLLYRITHPRPVMGIIDELRKVVWPSRQETANLTVVVLVVSIAIGIFLGAIDFGLNRVVEETLLP